MGGGCHMAKSMVTMCHMGRIILVSHMTLVKEGIVRMTHGNHVSPK